MKIMFCSNDDNNKFSQLFFRAEDTGDGHILGVVANSLQCELLGDGIVEYSLAMDDLLLLLTEIADKKGR